MWSTASIQLPLPTKRLSMKWRSGCAKSAIFPTTIANYSNKLHPIILDERVILLILIQIFNVAIWLEPIATRSTKVPITCCWSKTLTRMGILTGSSSGFATKHLPLKDSIFSTWWKQRLFISKAWRYPFSQWRKMRGLAWSGINQEAIYHFSKQTSWERSTTISLILFTFSIILNKRKMRFISH